MPFILRKTITETFLSRVQASPQLKAFSFRPAFSDAGEALPDTPEARPWRELSFREFHDRCRLISNGLMGLGVKPGDRVAILAQTRVEWSLSDMAILGARAVTVPIYPSTTPEEALYILEHSEASVLILDASAQLEKVLRIRALYPKSLPALTKIVVIEPDAMKLAVNRNQNIKDVITLQALQELGRREEGKTPGRFEANLSAASPDDWITICYTTGTTGTPKGVPLTHDNLMSVIEDCLERLKGHLLPEQETCVSFLPFSHVLGKVESTAVYVTGCRQVFAESIERLPKTLLEARPTILFAVPRIFEKAHQHILNQLDTLPAITRRLFGWACEVGRQASQARREHRRLGLGLEARNRLARSLVFQRIMDGFGGRLKFAISGGAPLSPLIGEFFDMAGIRILEGYGLTETCAPVTLNDPDCPRFGTVGKPLAEVAIRTSEEGEILVKSRKVFHGYYKLDEETRQVMQDGWFRTGDIGLIDRDGYLRITDRQKDLIITSSGKNVAPQKIEKIAKEMPPLSELVVHGDGRHFLSALVTLNRELVVQYANEHSIIFSEYSELIKHQKIVSWIERVVSEVNSRLAPYEMIRKFVILPQDFTIESGELTPALKVRRRVVEKHYREQLDALYASER